MKWTPFGKRRLGNLSSEKDSDLLFQAERELPPAEVILKFLRKASAIETKFKTPTNHVVREWDHLCGWLEAFLRVESDSLSKRFCSDQKSYECLVYKNDRYSEVNIVIRLKTINISGYTQYIISIAKKGDDEFICVE